MKNTILSFLIASLVSLQTLANGNLDKIKVTKYDKDRDGLAELMVIEYRDTRIATEIKGGKIAKLHTERDFKNKIIAKNTYEISGDKFVLTYNFGTKDRVFYNLDNHCGNDESPSSTTFDSTDIFMGVLNEPLYNFDSSCSEQNQVRLKEAIRAISADANNPVLNCIGKINLDLKNSLSMLPSGIEDIAIHCSASLDPKGSFERDKKRITVSQSCFGNKKQLHKTVSEEIIHAVGNVDEQYTKCLIAECPDMTAAKKCMLKNGTNSYVETSLNGTLANKLDGTLASANLDGSPTPAAQERINNNQKINVPSQIAAGTVPQPQISDFRTGQSVSSTYEPVGGNSFGNSMMRLAQNTILPDKAFAAESEPTRLANNNTGSTRSPANTNNAANSQWMNSGVSKSVGTGTNLQMPSVTVGESGTSGSSAGGSQRVEGQPGSEAKNARGGTVASVAGRAGTVAMTGGGGSGGRSLASTGGGSENSASAFGANSAKSFVNLKRSELVQTLNISANYPDYQQNLKNGEFNETLKENFIRIKDAKGVEHGFTEAEEKKFKAKLKPSDRVPRVIIYADTGRRLINNTRVTNNAP